MFCEHCGAKLEPGDLFCVNCGSKVEYNSDVQEDRTEEMPVVKPEPEKGLEDTQELTALEDPTAQPEKQKKPGGSTGLKVGVGIAAAVVVLLLAALVFFLVSGTSLSDLTGKRTNGAYSYSYGTDANAEDNSYEETTRRTTNRTTKKRTTEAEPEEPEASSDGEYYRVSVGSGNRLSLRAKPDEDSTKLDRIDNGTRLYITEIRGNWGKTTYAGETGWVCMTLDGDRYVVKD